MKPEKLGTVWTAAATLFGRDGRRLGRCIDTPNAIAKAFMEQPDADLVKTLDGVKSRSDYRGRMGPFNEAQSGFVYFPAPTKGTDR